MLRRPPSDLWGGLVVFGATVAVSWWRLADVAPHVLWAEDGRLFLQQALDSPGPLTWGRPYAGYLHLLPRIAASVVVATAPVPQYAVATTASAVVLAAAGATLVYVASSTVVSQPVARVAVALVPALLPVAPVEVSGSLANLHWYGLWTAGWLLVHRPTSRSMAWLLAVAMAAIGLSEVQTVFLLPAAPLAMASRPRRPVAFSLIMTTGLQLVANRLGPERGTYGAAPPGWDDVVVGFTGQVVSGAVWPPGLPVWQDGVVVATIGCWLLLVGLALCWGRPAERVAVVSLSAAAFGLYCAALFLNRPGGTDFSDWTAATWAGAGPSRYAVVPAMCVLGTVVLALVACWRRWSRQAVVLAVLATLVVVAAGWNVTPVREAGPAWPKQQEWARLCPTGQGSVTVPIAPADTPSRWRLTVPCDRVND